MNGREMIPFQERSKPTVDRYGPIILILGLVCLLLLAVFYLLLMGLSALFHPSQFPGMIDSTRNTLGDWITNAGSFVFIGCVLFLLEKGFGVLSAGARFLRDVLEAFGQLGRNKVWSVTEHAVVTDGRSDAHVTLTSKEREIAERRFYQGGGEIESPITSQEDAQKLLLRLEDLDKEAL